ncbi:MAG: hypothetical protein EBV06_13715 [Planctomycetia bacterium]|nr:hypothetical protein [Planctomycetia bacterium]
MNETERLVTFSHPTRRLGASLIAAIVTLTVVSLVMVLIASRLVSNRIQENARQQRIQRLWLARSGIEVAIQRLHAGSSDYKGETLELIPHSRVSIRIESEPKDKTLIHIHCEAAYPSNQSPVKKLAVSKALRLDSNPQPKKNGKDAEEPDEE